jgi:hypothetical protein
MALDDGIYINPAFYCHGPGLSLSREPSLVSRVEQYNCLSTYTDWSPRYMEKGRWAEAFKSSSRLRSHEIQAARDMYYASKLLEVEASQREGKSLWKEFFGVRRNRRAAQSAFFVMFMQQFCGVNVIAYYSTDIFYTGGFSYENALLVSLGTGIVNWLFAIPA